MIQFYLANARYNRKAEGLKSEYEDTYTVKVIRDEETLHVTAEFWFDKDEKYSRINGPAVQRFDRLSGRRTEAKYCLHGMIHRNEEEGPAVQQWDAETGNLTYEEYNQYATPSRSGNKPAVIYYDPKTGAVKESLYYNEWGDVIDPKTGQPYPEDEPENNDEPLP